MNKIKVLLYAVLTLVLGMALSSCSDDDGIPTVTPSASGTFTDADGTVYHWVRIGTLDWMVENYKGGDAWYTQSFVANRFEARFIVDDEDAEDALIAQQGNYFTWQQAKDCAPEGWRLRPMPTIRILRSLSVCRLLMPLKRAGAMVPARS